MNAEAPTQRQEKTEAEVAAQIHRIGRKILERAQKAGITKKDVDDHNEGLSYTDSMYGPHVSHEHLSSRDKTDSGEVYRGLSANDSGTEIQKALKNPEGKQTSFLEVTANVNNEYYDPYVQGKISKGEQRHKLELDQSNQAAASVLSDLRGKVASHEIEAEKTRRQEATQNLDEILKA